MLGFSKLHDMPYQAVTRLIKKGVLPCEQIGRLVFIDLEKLEIQAKADEKEVHEYVMRRAKFTCAKVHGGMF